MHSHAESVVAPAPHELETAVWHGCYDDSWRGLIVDEAFAHPAKFAPGLVRRIYGEMLGRGWLEAGALVGDPFGGIAGGGIIAAYMGLRWVGVELEPRFVALGERNIALHRDRLRGLGLPAPALLQGDSRGFAGVIGARVGAVVGSPPFGERRDGQGIAESGDTGTNPLGRSTLAAVVTSPPYAESNQNYVEGFKYIDPEKMVHNRPSQLRNAQYGKAPGQIGELPAGDIGAVVTSPPWEKGAEGGLRGSKFKDPAAFASKMSAADGKNGRHAASPEAREAQLRRDADHIYGNSDGQLGITSGETYWQAVAAVYASCRAALRPGGVMAVVVKDYVKDKRVVPLCEDTLRLLTALGFTPLLRARAALVKETVHDGLFGTHTQRRERKSFFRRLAEKKGSPRIDFEEVLFVRNPP